MRSKPSQHVFSIVDLAKWAPQIMKREAGGQDFRVSFRVNFRSAGRPAGMSRHNQQRSLLKKAARSWEAPMR